MTLLIKDINGRKLQSAYVNAPFDEAKIQLESKGYNIITPEQFAQLRMSQDANHSVSVNGAYISMGSIMIPQKGRYITEFSAIMQSPVEATKAHRNNKQFSVSSKYSERLLASGNVQIPYNQSEVPFNRFGEDPITVFVFGKKAKAYGEFLQETFKEAKIKAMPLAFDDKDYVDSQKFNFVNQLWLNRLDVDYVSELNGYSMGLDCSDAAVRGVRNMGVDKERSVSIKRNLYSSEAFFKAYANEGIIIRGDLETKIRKRLN